MLLMIFLALALAAVWNVRLLLVSMADWRDVQASKTNGSLQVISFARVRYKAVRLVVHVSMLAMLAPRVFWNTPPRPLVVVVVFVLVVVALILDVAADAYDAYLLRWFLKRREKRP